MFAGYFPEPIAKVQQEFYLYKCTLVMYYIKLIYKSINKIS